MARHTPARRREREEPVLTMHPSWKGMLGWYIKRMVVSAIVSGVAVALWNSGNLGWFWTLLVILISFGLPIGVGRLIRQATTYKVTSRRVSETSGIFNKKTESAFFEEITNTTVEQNVIERILKIGRLDFDTAGEHQARELGKARNYLAWWGVPNVTQVESLVDGLRYGDHELLDDEDDDVMVAEPRQRRRADDDSVL